MGVFYSQSSGIPPFKSTALVVGFMLARKGDYFNRAIVGIPYEGQKTRGVVEDPKKLGGSK